MEWLVLIYDFNLNKIRPYNVIYKDDIVEIKKKSKTKEEFEYELKMEMRYHYWSRCEYELIIEKTVNKRVLLSPWVARKMSDNATIDVTENSAFDWKAFADKHITHGTEEKIDVFDQLMFRWDEFVDYCYDNVR